MDFIRLGNVDKVDKVSNTASVLIEEDGVIKRAPKTAVGGDGGDWDAIIEINPDYGEVTLGGYDNIKNKINSNKCPRILIIQYISIEDGPDMKGITEPISCYYCESYEFINLFYANGPSVANLFVDPHNNISENMPGSGPV